MKKPSFFTTSQSSQMNEHEWDRLQILTLFEEEAYCNGFQYVVGIDEAGRGPLAGPVTAAACYIPKGIYLSGIDDSKKLTAKMRDLLFEEIVSDPRIIYAIGIIEAEIVDQINIYQATIQAMLQAINNLQVQPDYLLVDGLQLPHPSVSCQKIIKGDAKSQSIAAASVLAKVTRDRLMLSYHEQWPQYGFEKHKGYGTAKHLEALEQFGPCPIHRYTFEPIKSRYAEQAVNSYY